jgi:hypothetical protein
MIDYFTTRASAGATVTGAGGIVTGGAGAVSEASTTVRTVVTGRGAAAGADGARDDALAEQLDGFAGVTLDAEAQAAIAAALEECAARHRAVDAACREDDDARADAAEDDPARASCNWARGPTSIVARLSRSA